MNALALLLMASPLAAHEDLARACLAPELTLRLEPYKGEDAEAREKRRLERGESTDAAKADHLLAGRAEVRREADGSDNLTWRRGKGSKGVSDCVRRLKMLSARFPGRVTAGKPQPRFTEAGEKALANVPDAVRKEPSDAGLSARFFDSAAARSGAVAAVPLPRSRPVPLPEAAPRAEMPSSFTRPAAVPPAPLVEAAMAPFRGGGRHSRTAGMTIDTDGDLRGADPALAALARRDPHRQAQTSLTFRNGRSLDPTRVPYVVIPLGDRSAKLGDYVVVEYNGRSVLAIVGDRGPRHRFGEGSMALAKSLGINPSGTTGGVERGVKYTFLGYGVGRPKSADELQAALAERSSALLRR